MKIERDKAYLTRSGKRVDVLATGLVIDGGRFNIVGLLDGQAGYWYQPPPQDQDSDRAYWKARWSGQHENDLIAEWRDPPTPLEFVKKFRESCSGQPGSYLADQCNELVRMADEILAAEKGA